MSESQRPIATTASLASSAPADAPPLPVLRDGAIGHSIGGPSALPEVEWPEDPGLPDLSDQQREALQYLSRGAGIAATSRAVGVSRTTLYHWLARNPSMRAAHNAWKHAARESARSRLVALLDCALDVIAEKMESGRDARTALLIVERLGMFKRSRPGSPEIEDVKKEIGLDSRRRKADRVLKARHIARDQNYSDSDE